MEERLDQQIRFLIEIDKMKSVLRQTLIADKSRRENDAEHSWHLAVMAMVLFEYAEGDNVNLHRVIKMTLVHDLVEVYAGDTFAYDDIGNQDKAERENAAADKLFSMLPLDQAAEIRTLWEEFDEMKTPDARYAAAMDRLQPLINNYLTEGHTWKIGNVTSDKVYGRMSIIKQSVPRLWPYVDGLIQDCIARGCLRQI